MHVFLQCHVTEGYYYLLGEIGTVACFSVANICKTQSFIMQWNSHPISIDDEKKHRTFFIFLRMYMWCYMTLPEFSSSLEN